MRSTSLPAAGSWIAALWTILFSTGFGPPSGGGGGFGQGGGFGPSPASQNPYSQPPGMMGPPPRKSNSWIWILGIVGVGGLVVCGCCGGFSMWAMSQGMGMMADAARQEAAASPVVQEHIGEITSASMNFIKSTQETEKRGTGDNFLVIEIKGSKSNGELIVEQSKNPQPGEMFNSMELRMPSGEVHTIR